MQQRFVCLAWEKKSSHRCPVFPATSNDATFDRAVWTRSPSMRSSRRLSRSWLPAKLLSRMNPTLLVLTDSMPSLPNLFLVGAAKAGTTSVHALLDAHPDVFMSPIKETNFFSQHDLQPELYSKIYRKTLDHNIQAFRDGHTDFLHIADIHSPKEYKSLFRGANSEAIVGECSNSYLFCPSAAPSIAEHNPDAKILIILRQPVERAWSHYLMNIKIGHHVLPSFLEEVKQDTAAHPSGWGITANYFTLGLYAAQVARFYKHFPEDQIKVLLFNDFRDQTAHVLNDLWAFLEIPPVHLNAKNFERNVSGVPRLPRLNRILRTSKIVRQLHRISPAKLRQLGEYLLVNRMAVPKLSKADRIALLKMYKSDIRELESIIQRPLDYWLY